LQRSEQITVENWSRPRKLNDVEKAAAIDARLGGADEQRKHKGKNQKR